MCPHCLNQSGGCVHCSDRPLRPPTETSLQNFQLAARTRGVTKSALTNDDRIALQIFTKPWRGIARERGHVVRPPRSAQPATSCRNAVLPANFQLADRS